jgi:large subunit ribosomal protein L25
MAQQATLSAAPRGESGKGVARRLRREGKVPAVIYGRGREPETLQLDATALERLLSKIRAATTIVDINVPDRPPVKALIREIQRNPVRPSDILHIDLYEIHADEKISIAVPLHFVGTAEGVRNSGGIFEAVLHDVQIRVLPADIPERIEVDVTNLSLGQSLHVSDVKLAAGEILTDGEVTICTVVAPKTEEAAAPAETAATPAEPELIRKPKLTEEEEGEKKD